MNIKFCALYACVLIVMHSSPAVSLSLERRERGNGLYKTISSTTIGKGNLFLHMDGRGFLWDSDALQLMPTVISRLELGYGFLDFAHISLGSYLLDARPGLTFMKIKITTPNTKNLRFIGVGQTIEIYRNFLTEFEPGGYRYKNEGFAPDFFITGNDNFVTYFRFMTAIDFEAIKLNAAAPFKFYLNAGFEGGMDWFCKDGGKNCWFSENGAGRSWIGENIKEAWRNHARANQLADGDMSYRGTTNFQKVPLRIGAELKTLATDFFLEMEAEPFLEHLKSLFRSGEDGNPAVVRFNSIAESHSAAFLKVFDMHIFETPIYINAGGRLKYPNGMTLQGGISWLISRDYGPKSGSCDKQPDCKEGATDGFSPFYPQWRLFSGVSLPLRFYQTSAELFRMYLLRRNSQARNFRDLYDYLKEKRIDINEIDKQEPSENFLRSTTRSDKADKSSD